MAGGYRSPAGDELGPLLKEIKRLRRRLSELETPTGTSMTSLVAQVQAKLAELDATVSALVADYVASYSYTQATIDAKIASPGAISPTSVNAGGSVVIADPHDLYSIHGRNTPVVTSYVSAYFNSDGRLGADASRRDMKDHIEEYEVPEGAWALRPVVFTYKEDPLQTPRLGFYAEDANDADPLFAVHEDGEPHSLHDRALIAALWGMVRNLNERVQALES